MDSFLHGTFLFLDFVFYFILRSAFASWSVSHVVRYLTWKSAFSYFFLSPTSLQPIANAGDTAFWTKLNWKSTCKSGANLRLIVNSKSVIMGSANFNTDDLLNAVSDDKGLRRVSSLSIIFVDTVSTLV